MNLFCKCSTPYYKFKIFSLNQSRFLIPYKFFFPKILTLSNDQAFKIYCEITKENSYPNIQKFNLLKKALKGYKIIKFSILPFTLARFVCMPFIFFVNYVSFHVKILLPWR